jgi:hypothetical protein
MTNPSAGGVPPAGADFNGILKYITGFQSWVNAGGQFAFNATLAASIGGYPVGAVLQLNGGMGCVVSTVNGNSNDPNSVMTGWLPYGGVFPAGQVLVGSGTGTVSTSGLTFSTTTGLSVNQSSTLTGSYAISCNQTVTPIAPASTSIAAFNADSTYAGTQNSTGSVYAASLVATNSATAGTVASVICIQVSAVHTGAGTTTALQGLNVSAGKTAGTVTSVSGIYVNAITAGSSVNYAIYTNAGVVNFGDTTACTGPLTGALQVSGGASIAGSLNIGGGSVPMNKYDEGTWTPAGWPGGGTGVTTMGKWVRTGNVVHITVQINGTGLTTSANMIWPCLPFTAPTRESTGALNNTGMTQAGSVAISGNSIYFSAMTSTAFLVCSFDIYLN